MSNFSPFQISHAHPDPNNPKTAFLNASLNLSKLPKSSSICFLISPSNSLPLAKILEDGQVYAIDILNEPLSALRSKAKTEKLFNIETRKENIEKGTLLLNETCDLVLMTNLLFQVDDRKRVLEEGRRILRPGGQILVVDWKKDNPLTLEIEKVSAEEIKETALDLNLRIAKEFEAGSYHFGIIFKK